MAAKPSNLLSDLRGAGRLTIDAVIGMTDLVEAFHHKIITVGGILGASNSHRTKGITGMVYRNIRTVTGWVGGGMDAVLDQFVAMSGEQDSSRGREAVLSALNGVLGDHLAAQGNPLAIPMQLRRHGKPLAMNDRALHEAIRQSQGKVVLLVHGSCTNDLQWHRQGHDHGAALARDLGYLPVYLHYNSGLHISQNGYELAALLQKFIDQLPKPIDLTMVSYSMGGLVSRSACHYGKGAGHTWLDHLRKLVCIGTPHHGAPLERCGNWLDFLLEISPYSAPFARLGKIRSAGITDLRYGHLLHEDWQARDRFELAGDRRRAVPLPDGVQCYAIAATTGKAASRLGDHLVGDGLVPLASALGHHKRAELNLPFPESHRWIGRKMNHLDLLNNSRVYEIINQWLKS